jgi:hypothetical protein
MLPQTVTITSSKKNVKGETQAQGVKRFCNDMNERGIKQLTQRTTRSWRSKEGELYSLVIKR